MYPQKDYEGFFDKVSLTAVSPNTTVVESDNYPDGFTVLSVNSWDASMTRAGLTYWTCGNEMSAMHASSSRIAEVMALPCTQDLELRSTISATHDVYYNVTIVPYLLEDTVPTTSIQDSGNLSFGLALIVFFLCFLVWGYIRNSYTPHE